MGLDIYAYSQLKFYPYEAFTFTQDDYDWERPLEDHRLHETFAFKGFEASTRGLPAHDEVKDNHFGKWIAVGWAQETKETKDFSFRAGSYSGYNNWRRTLSTALFDVTPDQMWKNPENYTDYPFFELINFADNEGCIGPDAAADLYGDFVAHETLFNSRMLVGEDALDRDDSNWYILRYRDWKRAFELAMDSGMVEFG